MPIANMRELISRAAARGHAVGAFSVSGVEMMCGVLSAAEALSTPVIIQVAERRLETTPLPVIGKAMLAAASSAGVPVAVHLDHGATMDCIRQALDVGFTSVMYDGSSLGMQQNIENTLKVRALAQRYGAAVEAEIGRLGRTEEGNDAPAAYSEPDDCVYFADSTGVDALAVAIGNAHGVYVGAPVLRFDVLERISGLVSTPLVLHGGTGISDEDFRHCVRLGVRKINIATATFIAAAKAAHEADEIDYFDMSRRMTQAARLVADRYIHVFGVAGEEDEAL